MLHVKQTKDSYFAAVEEWNRTHRIIGKRSIGELVAQSEQALRFVPKDVPAVVDVGAGAGILGIPWVLGARTRKAALVEPDPKKSAFLRSFVSTAPEIRSQLLILNGRIEDVTRETLVEFFQTDFILAARAFSGTEGLAVTMQRSEFSRDATYIFKPLTLRPGEYVLEKLTV